MRLSLRNALSAAAALTLAASAFAQTAVTGFPVTDDCASGIDNTSTGEQAELYAVKVVSLAADGDAGTDWLVDTSTKGGAAIGLAAVNNPGYLVSPNWSVPDLPAHDVHVFLTYANGGLVVDSGNLGTTLGDFSLVRRQTVGNAPAAGSLAGTGFSPGGSINLGGAGTVTFPVSGKSSVMLAMAPLVEVNNADGGTGCSIGGEVDGDAADGSNTRVGLVTGYNVYRIPGTAGPPPTPTLAQFIDNWAYLARIDGFNMALADPSGTGTGTPPAGDGTNGPTDGANADTDLVGWENLDAVPYNGNEVVVFSDQALNPDGSARAGGTAGPDTTGVQGYWYAWQPVVSGKVSSFTNASINAQAASDHTLNMGGGAANESVDLDGVTTSAEFISPQVEHGVAFGLGLTYKGLPLVSQWVFGQCNPAPVGEGVTFNASVGAGGVNITFSAALEAGNVLGFNVYRVEGGAQTKVNDQIIAARGGEGSVYSVVDVAEGSSRRVRRDSALQYTVEVVYNDGTPSKTVGPFTVVTDRGETTRRTR